MCAFSQEKTVYRILLHPFNICIFHLIYNYQLQTGYLGNQSSYRSEILATGRSFAPDCHLIGTFLVPALGGLQRPSKAGRGRIFFLAQTVPFDLSVNPWWSLKVSGPLRTLQRPRGRQKASQGRNFFLAQTVPFDLSINLWLSLTVSGPPGPSSGLEAIEGRLRPKFFLA